jgi:hypothetical protein
MLKAQLEVNVGWRRCEGIELKCCLGILVLTLMVRFGRSEWKGKYDRHDIQMFMI